jgi:predicted PurR-regulated permease PerM
MSPSPPPARDPREPRSPFAVLTAAVFTLLLLLFLYNVAEVLFLFFLAALFALFLSAIMDFMEDRFAAPRWAGLIVAILVTLTAVTGVGWLIVPPVLRQTQDLLVALPGQITLWAASLREFIARYPALATAVNADEATAQVSEALTHVGGYLSSLFPYVFNGLHAVVNVISVLVMGIYLALRPDLYREGVIALAPPVHRELVRDILSDLGRSLKAWIGGQIIAMFFLGMITWGLLSWAGVPYALAFGVFTGVVVMVPFFGTLVSTLLPALFVLGPDGPLHALLVVMIGVIVHLVEANLVHPLIMERQVNLPPVLSILSVLVMAELLGAIGLVVAVPVLVMVMVVVRRIYVHRLLEGKGFRRFVRDAPSEVRIPDGVARVDRTAHGLSIPALLEEAGAAPR